MSYSKADLEVIFRQGIIAWQKRNGVPFAPDEFKAALDNAVANVKKVKHTRQLEEANDSNALIEEMLRDGKDLEAEGVMVELLNPNALKAGK